MGPMDDRDNIGRSEVILGKAIKGKRDDVVITSKRSAATSDKGQTTTGYHDTTSCGR